MTNERSLLAGTYEIIEEIGAGGGGIVYRAIHKRLQIDVVIKKIKEEVVSKVKVRQEADVLKRLKHPYLPRVYDFIETDDGVYTVMDYIKGMDMDKALQQRGRFTVEEVKKWALQLGEALDYLHKQNPPIIHSDIKPSNIMLTKEGDVCLIDFNISLAMGGSEEASVGVSAGFSPPEQYRDPGLYAQVTHNYTNPSGPSDKTEILTQATMNPANMFANSTFFPYIGKGISTRSDIYSLGMCLMTFLTGLRPDYNFDNNHKIREYDLKVSEGFATIIDKMTEVSPDLRYKDGVEYLNELRNCRKLDHRYVKMHRRQIGLRTASSILIIAGAAVTAFGLTRIKADKDTEYYSLIDEAEEAIANLDIDEATDLIEEAMKYSSSNIAAYREEVYLYYATGDYEECISLGEKYAKTTPFYIETKEAKSYLADIYYLVGNAYFELGDNNEAIHYIERAISYDSENANYYRDYAVIVAMAGDADEAEKYLKKAQKLGLKDVSTNLVKAEICHIKGEDDEATSILEDVIKETDDKNILRRAVMLCSDIYKSMGDGAIDSEIGMLEDALKRADTGSDRMISEYLANAYSRKASAYPSEAEEYYSKAISILEKIYNSGYSTYRIMENIGILYENKGDLYKAEEIFIEMSDKYPERYEAYVRLAYLEADKQQSMDISERDYLRMKEYYEKAIALCKDNDDVEIEMLSRLMEDIIAGGWIN